MALYLLVSGDSLYIGLGVIVAGGILGFVWPRWGVSLALGGGCLAIASAVPLPLALYAFLVTAVVAWAAAASRSRRVRRGMAGVMVATAVTVSVAAYRAEPSVRHVNSDDRPIFVIGDSLSAGVGAPSDGTWPSLLAAHAQRRVMNLARAGARLGDGASQARAVTPGRSLVLIELGGNDILGGASVDQFADSLRALLHNVSGRDRTIVIFELPLLPLQNRFGLAQRRVCAESGVALIPRRILAGAIALPGHAQDGLHLSQEGHRWLAREVEGWL